MRRTGVLLVIALVAVALAAAGCGGDDDSVATDPDTVTETTETTEPVAGGGTLAGKVGPGFEISLETADGQPAESLAPGSYELEVEDLSSAHNFHLTGPGVDVMTDVAGEGVETFTVELQAGTYDFVCDPHASSMRGSIAVG